jgi:hypothetical protein
MSLSMVPEAKEVEVLEVGGVLAMDEPVGIAGACWKAPSAVQL